jgi:hypothetical protein
MRHAAIASDHLIASEKRPRQVTDHIQNMSSEEHGKDVLFVFSKSTKNSPTARELKYHASSSESGPLPIKLSIVN